MQLLSCPLDEWRTVRGEGSSPGSVEGSSRAMLAIARPSCLSISYSSVYYIKTSELSHACSLSYSLEWETPVDYTLIFHEDQFARPTFNLNG